MNLIIFSFVDYVAPLELQIGARREENHYNSDGSIPNSIPSSILTSSVQNSTEPEQPVKQEPVPYYRTHRAHARALSELIDSATDASKGPDEGSSENDCSIVGEIIDMPLPLESTKEGLIKRENDIISANKPFTETVCIFESCFTNIFLK